MPWRIAALALVVVGGTAPSAAAQEIWGSLSLPGGAQAARLALAVGPLGERPDEIFLLDYIERYTLLRNTRIGSDAQRYFQFHFDLTAAIAARPDGCSLPPPGAPGAAVDRERNCLTWLGLRLRERSGVFSVEGDSGGAATDRRGWLAAAGIDSNELSARLNRGEPAPVVVPRSDVPLPLPGFWDAAVFSNDEPGIASIVAGPNAALLYRGLLSLDPDTLRFMDRRHALLRRLLGDAPATFAAFSRSLFARDDRLRLPGGDSAVPLWERLVGQGVDQPEAFVAELFTRDRGRLAYFYDAVTRLDPVRQGFLLGAEDDADRLDRVRRVYEVFRSFEPVWDAGQQPLPVPRFDPAIAVAFVGVSDTGVIGPDWWPSLLERVVDNDDWPDRPEDTARRLRDRPGDARWYLAWLFDDPGDARRRFELLRYLQRRVPSATRADAYDAELALRTMREMPALALSLERMGVEDPAVVGAMGRRMRELAASGSRDRVLPAVTRWQNVIGWIEQAYRHRLITREQLRTLIDAAAAAIPAREGDAGGTAAAWFVDVLLPEVVGATDLPSTETGLVQAMFADRERTDAPVVWEGLEYRIERWAPVARGFDAIRAVQTGPRLSDLIRLLQARRAIESGVASLDALAAVRAAIDGLADLSASAGLGIQAIEDEADARRTVLRNLARITRPGDLSRATRELDRLARMADAMTDAVLRPTLYALAALPTSQPAALLADHWTRHRVEEPRPGQAGPDLLVIWDVPRPTRATAGGVSVSGSWLALDIALADAQLRDVSSSDLLPPPYVTDEDRQAIVGSLSLRPDIGAEAVAPTGRVAAGRARLDAWARSPATSDEMREALTAAGADPSRVNVAMWVAARNPDGAEGWLTMTELFWLGGGGVLPPSWGVAAPAVDGCLCFEPLDVWMAGWFRDRPGSGLAGALVTDLPLRLAEHLEHAGLPMTLVPLLLRGATPDWLGRTWQIMPGDAGALEVFPRRLPRLRLDDYLLALVADRVLAVPDGGER